MTNYENFQKQCKQALENNEIDKVDFKLLLKIAKAIYDEDTSIEMTLVPFSYCDRHSIKCWGAFTSDFQDKIKKAMKKSYVYFKNVDFGYGDCEIRIPTSKMSETLNKALSDRRNRLFNEQRREMTRKHSHFGELIDFIVKLAEKGNYEKCDGILMDLIQNYNTSAFITEEEVINDLKAVINGTTIEEDEESEWEIYSDEVKAIANKYNAQESQIKQILQIKLRCFDKDYIYKDGFFDLTPSDYEIIERKLKGEPFDDVKPWKMLSEIEL